MPFEEYPKTVAIKNEADILTRHSRLSTGINNNINEGSVYSSVPVSMTV